jgi:1,2-diacylglycerol 3-alpha-glucosyltransferase
MNILLTNLTYKPHFGGVENSLFYIAQEYKEMGHNVVIMCSDVNFVKKEGLTHCEILDSIKVFRYKRYNPKSKLLKLFLPISDIVNSYFLAKKLHTQYKFDFSIARNMKVGVGVYFALKQVPIIHILPAISRHQDKIAVNDFSKFTLKKIISLISNKITIFQNDFFQKFLIKSSNYNIVFSQNMYTQVNELTKVDNSKILKIYPGVDSNRFTQSNNKLQLREELNIDKNKKIFLIIGRLIEVKNISIVIKSFINVKSEERLLIIVGDGPKLNDLKSLVLKYNLEQYMIFFDKTNKPEKFYQISDAFIMSSSYEPFGQTILEAMSTGLPIIAFKSDGINVRTATEEIVENAVNGLLCEYSTDELTKSIDNFINLSEEKVKIIGWNNREKVKRIYSWKIFVEKILKLNIKNTTIKSE